MTDRAIHRSAALVLVLALAVSAAPAIASVHHHADHRRTTGRHASTDHPAAKSSHHHTNKGAGHRDATPSGVTSVPAGGVKLFCPAHRSPLLIRKSTQGAGTTVTMVCR